LNLDYVPLLRVMRELHSIPRGQPPDFNGMKRFRQYLRTIFPDDKNADQLIPLLAMNPMGKEHVTAALDAYLAMDGDGIGARAAAEAAARLTDVPGDFKVGLVVADDLLGGRPRISRDLAVSTWLAWSDQSVRAQREPRRTLPP